MDDVTLLQGDCLDRMGEIPDGSIDAIITDPPYPEIDRPYGRMTEVEWDAMMRRLIPECRRVLKSTGSAVFILQPNSERVGRMRPWLWEFMAWTTREWGMVQDAWWWNVAAIPEAHSIQGRLMRPSLKACVWLGSPGCYRDQDAVLWSEAASSANRERAARASNEGRINSPSGQGSTRANCGDAARRRGGVTPFNVFPCPNGERRQGHPAGTPHALADWWVRYISPPGGTVLDPFNGSGTVTLAALARGRKAIGIERDAGYHEISRVRHEAARLPMFAGST